MAKDVRSEASERYVQLFAWEGVEPAPDEVMAGLTQLGLPAHRSDLFADTVGPFGWRQSMLVGFPGEPVFVEVFRPGDHWEGTIFRGTFEQQLKQALNEAASDSNEMLMRLHAVRFILATSSLDSEASRLVTDAIRHIVERRVKTVVRIDGRLERGVANAS
jgi:hypothetical protein